MVRGRIAAVLLWMSLAAPGLTQSTVLEHPESVAADSGVEADLRFLLQTNPIAPDKARRLPPFPPLKTNELKTALMGVIRVYQLVISSQDVDACTFTPSCSRFGMASLEKYGLFPGLLMSSDRLQRCHGCSRKYYPTHPHTGKCDDPPEREYLGKR